jgi:hypothetical protein
MLAVYDALVAIEGGFETYAARIQAPARADRFCTSAGTVPELAEGRLSRGWISRRSGRDPGHTFQERTGSIAYEDGQRHRSRVGFQTGV